MSVPAGLATLIRDGAPGIVARCEVWRAGEPVDAPVLVDGQITWDATRADLRDATLTVRGSVPTSAMDDLAPSTHEVAVWWGIRDWSGEVVEVPVGVYAYDTIAIARASRTTAISAFDRSRAVSEARWMDPYVIPAGTSVAGAIAAALATRLPFLDPAEVNFASAGTLSQSVTFGVERDNDPWDDLTSLAASRGMWLRFGPDGTPTMDLLPDPDTADIDWSFTAGEEPTFYDLARSLTGRPYNMVDCFSEPGDDDDGEPLPVHRWVASDDNPASAGYVGRYRRPYFMPVGYISRESEVRAAAEGQLRRLLGLSEQVTIHSAVIPLLDAYSIVDVDDAEMGVPGVRYAIDQVRFPLRPGRQEMVARRRDTSGFDIDNIGGGG